MGGLAKICKMFGAIESKDEYGKKVTWIWDYVTDTPRIKSEMSKSELMESERIKWLALKSKLDSENNIYKMDITRKKVKQILKKDYGYSNLENASHRDIINVIIEDTLEIVRNQLSSNNKVLPKKNNISSKRLDVNQENNVF